MGELGGLVKWGQQPVVRIVESGVFQRGVKQAVEAKRLAVEETDEQAMGLIGEIAVVFLIGGEGGVKMGGIGVANAPVGGLGSRAVGREAVVEDPEGVLKDARQAKVRRSVFNDMKHRGGAVGRGGELVADHCAGHAVLKLQE